MDWRGVRQGYCMSPILFSLYGEYLIKEALVEVGDFKIVGWIINVRFADDTAIIAKNQEIYILLLYYCFKYFNFPFLRENSTT